MRHKQRPVKSSRHKSVTFIIDSHTSFGDNNNDSQHQQQQQHKTHYNYQQQIHLHKSISQAQPIIATPTSYRSQRIPAHYGSGSGSAVVGVNISTNNSMQQQQVSGNNHRSNSYQQQNRRSNSLLVRDEPSPLIRKYEHNYRHMSDVMRLAFLENNDISIEDCTNVDFNSLSTASILQRNIQQQLQQERRDQLHLRQQQQQQQQLNLQSNNHHNNNIHHHHHHNQQQQPYHHLQLHNQEEQYDQGLDADFDTIDDYDDISDSRIFATATPHSSSHKTTISNNRAPKAPLRQAGGAAQRNTTGGGGVASGAKGKRRTRDSTPHVEFSEQVQVETIQNDGDGGFLCDEPGCGKSFPSLRKLRHHKVVHSDDFPFVCDFRGCGKKFKRKFGIDLHSTTHFDLDPDMYSKTSNNSSLPFFGRRMQYSMCKPCGQKFKTVHEYQYHMLKHGKEPFKCPVKGCGQTFSIWKSFQKHRASHYFNYFCKMDPRCDHHTSNLQLLKLHIYCCHFRRELPENATLSSKDPAEEAAEPEPQVEVEEEDVGREDSIDIMETSSHSDDHTLIKIEDDIEDPLETNETPEKPIIPELPTTPRRDSRLRKNPPRSSTFGHQDYASINNGSIIVKSSPTTRSAKKTKPPVAQVSLISEPPSPVIQPVNCGSSRKGFFCEELGCGKSFPSLRKLRHHKVVHSDDFPFICEFEGCGKKFKRKFGIDLHSTTHFDLDPEMYSKTSNNSSLPFFGRRMQYSMCKPCGQKFKTVHEYQYHMLKHGKEPFKCPVKGCGQTFGIWKSFQKHRASHYFNYYCKIDSRCDHHTSNLQLLKLHIYCCHFRRKLPANATINTTDRI